MRIREKSKGEVARMSIQEELEKAIAEKERLEKELEQLPRGSLMLRLQKNGEPRYYLYKREKKGSKNISVYAGKLTLDEAREIEKKLEIRQEYKKKIRNLEWRIAYLQFVDKNLKIY